MPVVARLAAVVKGVGMEVEELAAVAATVGVVKEEEMGLEEEGLVEVTVVDSEVVRVVEELVAVAATVGVVKEEDM